MEMAKFEIISSISQKKVFTITWGDSQLLQKKSQSAEYWQNECAQPLVGLGTKKKLPKSKSPVLEGGLSPFSVRCGTGKFATSTSGLFIA